MRIINFFKSFDWRLFIPLILLILIGIVIIYSATWGETGENLTKIKTQIIAALIGLVLFFSLSAMDYRILKNYSFLIYFAMLLLLGAVLFFGIAVRGSRSWFSLGWFNFQPSEIAKIFLVIALAAFWAKRQENIHRLSVIISSALLAFLPVCLVIFEHDLGAAIILLAIWAGMLIVAGLKIKYILITAGFLILLFGAAWLFLLAPYQKARIVSFLNPSVDPLGANYNVIQSVIAVGSGGLWGKGLGHGSQSQLKFLPE